MNDDAATDLQLHWNSPEGLQALLLELVSWKSVSHSTGEAAFPERFAQRLRDVPYFASRPEAIGFGAADGDQRFVTALYRTHSTARTVVLISHHDTVSTEDFGELEELACDPLRLGPAIQAIRSELDADAQADLDAGGWLWGRGTMDMKMGLALHTSLLERAAAEDWPLNLLLLTVPDEEVNSAGMRAAAERLVELRDAHGLEYILFLNGEFGYPHADPDTRTLHTGSIGKLMPSALMYGRETHAGSPLEGITSSWIASYLTRRMEWTDAFRETVHGEATPLPVSLAVTDIREGYSVKTPYRTSALYNVFIMELDAREVLERFEQIAREAAAECTADYRAMCARENAEPLPDIRVMRYEELLTHAIGKLGQEHVMELLTSPAPQMDPDERDQAFHTVDVLLRACQELTPAIIVLFAPPAYPAVCSTGVPLIEACVDHVAAAARDRFGLSIERGHYFPGISDLSYVNHDGGSGGWEPYERNTPHYGNPYRIPFAAMGELRAPVLNIGPLGKDAHKRTERLHIHSAFTELPELVGGLLRDLPDLLHQQR